MEMNMWYPFRRRLDPYERAKNLLFRFLDEDNRDLYEREGQIEFTGSDGRRYRIRNNHYQGNVYQLNDKGDITRRLCGHPRWIYDDGQRTPIETVILAQWTMLRYDAPEFLRIANRF